MKFQLWYLTTAICKQSVSAICHTFLIASSNGYIFCVTVPLCGKSPVNSTHKGQWRGALMFSLICARIYAYVNKGEAGDLRHIFRHLTANCGFLTPYGVVELGNALVAPRLLTPDRKGYQTNSSPLCVAGPRNSWTYLIKPFWPVIVEINSQHIYVYIYLFMIIVMLIRVIYQRSSWSSVGAAPTTSSFST